MTQTITISTEAAAALRSVLSQLDAAPAPAPTPAPTPQNMMPAVSDADYSMSGYWLRGGALAGLPPQDLNFMFSGMACDEYDTANGLSPGTTATTRNLWPAALALWMSKPKYVSKKLKAAYTTKDELLADCAGYNYAVLLDGNSVHQGSGPADNFSTQPNGTVVRVRVSAATLGFATEAQLMAAFPGQAITVDGYMLQGGFGQANDLPLAYKTALNGRLVPA